MATKYCRGAGPGDWNTDASWSTTSSAGAANTTKPTSADTVILDAGSAAITTVDTSAQACTSLNCSGYTGSLVLAQQLTVTGNVTFVAGMTFTHGNQTLIINGGTFIPAGKTLYDLTISNLTGSVLLSTSDVIVEHNLSLPVSTAIITGTRKITLTGGTWTAAPNACVLCNVDLAGNVTISGTVVYGTGTLTYVSGTITTVGSTLSISMGCTLNTPTANMSWNNITQAQAGLSRTLTLTSAITLTGTLSSGAASASLVLATSDVTCAGLTTFGSITGVGRTIYLTGGTWSNTSGTNPCGTNLTITGNVIVSGHVYYGSQVLNASGANLTVAGSILSLLGNCTITDGVNTWNDLYIGTATTLTLTTAFLFSGTLGLSANLSLSGDFDFNPTSITTFSGGTRTLTLVRNMATVATLNLGVSLTLSGNYNFNCTTINVTAASTLTLVRNMATVTTLTLTANLTLSGDYDFNCTTITTVTGGTRTLTLVRNMTPCTTVNLGVSFTLSGNYTFSTHDFNCTASSTFTPVATQLMVVTGNCTISNGATLTLATGAFTINGTLDTNSTGKVSDQSVVFTGGSSVWQATGWVAGSSGYVSSTVVFNGDTTIIGNVPKHYTLTYISGVLTVTGSTIHCTNSTTWDMQNTPVNNVTISGGGSFILTSGFYVEGDLKYTIAGVTVTGSGVATFAGNISTGSNNFSPPGGIVIVGTSTVWTATNSSVNAPTFSVYNLTINSPGTVTLPSPFYFSGTLTYISGTFGSSLSITLVGSSAIDGTFSIENLMLACYTETPPVANLILTLTSGKTITVSNLVKYRIPGEFSWDIVSSVPTTNAGLKFSNLNSLPYFDTVTATDIDSSGGVAVLNQGGTNTRCTNWYSGWNTYPGAHDVFGIVN